MKFLFPVFVAVLFVAGCGTVTRALLTPTYNVDHGTNTAQIVGYTVNTNSALAKTLGTVDEIAPLVPAPWGTIVGGVSALAGASLALFAKLRTANAEKILDVVIAGVEAAGNADVKAKINQVALAHGVEGQLSSKVNP